MMKMHVAVTDSVFPNLDPATQVLSELNAELALAGGTTPDQILDVARDADGLLVTYAKVPAQVIEKLTRCKIIARFGIGVDNVDIDAATRAGIMVTNVPEYCEDEVSDHAMALLLALIRKIPLADRKTHAGTWSMPAVVPIHRIRGRLLGLIGFGKIPRLVAAKAQAFGLQVQTYDPFITAEVPEKLGVRLVSLPELLGSSDYISIHAPLTPETHRMFNAKAFGQMKRGALLVNTARGPLVDVEDLVDALEAKQIGGAGLDVLPEEPPPENSRLYGRDDVILTPHTGFYSEESMVELQTKAAQQVALVLSGKEPRYPVNLKALQAGKA
ncbi:MAG: C-terminal binding protein [Thermodesulfobacteriota bacterium]